MLEVCRASLVENHWYWWRGGVWVLHLSSTASLLASRTLRKKKEILDFWFSVFWMKKDSNSSTALSMSSLQREKREFILGVSDLNKPLYRDRNTQLTLLGIQYKNKTCLWKKSEEILCYENPCLNLKYSTHTIHTFVLRTWMINNSHGWRDNFPSEQSKNFHLVYKKQWVKKNKKISVSLELYWRRDQSHI